jgi:hypothetical protein
MRSRDVERRVHRRSAALLVGTAIGRFVLRRRLARARRQAMTVVGAATVAGMIVLVLAAERERARGR